MWSELSLPPSNLSEKLHVKPNNEMAHEKHEKQQRVMHEALSQPSSIGNEASGVHDTTFQSTMKCDVDIRKVMYANVAPSGVPQSAGIGEKMTKDPTALAPPTMKDKKHDFMEEIMKAVAHVAPTAGDPGELIMGILRHLPEDVIEDERFIQNERELMAFQDLVVSLGGSAPRSTRLCGSAGMKASLSCDSVLACVRVRVPRRTPTRSDRRIAANAVQWPIYTYVSARL